MDPAEAQPRAISVTSVSSEVRNDPLDSWTGPGRAGRRFFTTEGTEGTEDTEALGSLASHTTGLRIRFNHFLLGSRNSGVARRRRGSLAERIETAFTAILCFLRVLRVALRF
jgi:hypothetical protein